MLDGSGRTLENGFENYLGPRDDEVWTLVRRDDFGFPIKEVRFRAKRGRGRPEADSVQLSDEHTVEVCRL